MIKLEDLDQSHVWEAENGMSDPHSSGYQCRTCWITVCAFCSSQQNVDYEEAISPCPGEPPGAKEQLSLGDIASLAEVGRMYLTALDDDPENEALTLGEAFIVTDVRKAVENAERLLKAAEETWGKKPSGEEAKALTSFMERSRVAWWGKVPEPGVCQCCQLARAVYRAFNGELHLAIRACSKCMTPDHIPEACEDRR